MANQMTNLSRRARKTERRLEIIDGVLSALTSPKTFREIDRSTWDEDKICAHMQPFLVDGMKIVFRSLYPDQRPKTIERKAVEAVLWGGGASTTIREIHLYGVVHQPDFVVNAGEARIVIEVKRGTDGSAVRDGMGQSLVYSTHYDFVIYLLIDVSPDKKIIATVDQPIESQMTDALWDQFNIKLEVV